MRHRSTAHRACAIAVWTALSLAATPRTITIAQTHVIDASVELGSASVREDLLVPIAFTGPALALRGRYELLLDAERISAELGVGFGLLFERFGELGAQLPHSAALGYAHALHADAFELELGGALRWQDEISYLTSWDDAHGYWLSTLALGPTLRYARALSPSIALEASAELALFGLASRPAPYRWNKQDALTHLSYHVDRISDAEPFWLLDVQLIRLELLARPRSRVEPIGSGWGFGAFARLARASDPKPYAALYAGLVCKHGWEL